MSVKTISPVMAQKLIEQGAELVDIRSVDEYAREHIKSAKNIPMALLTPGSLAKNDSRHVIIFHCGSGNRTQINIPTLAACTDCDAYVLEGGLSAWKKAQLPVVFDKTQPMELQRQVQIIAGSLILLGVILGFSVSPGFFILSGFIGAGLVFAGLSGFCGLARVLMRMPWNRRAT